MRPAAVRHLVRELLIALGEDPDREGLAGTPDRVARWWAEFLNHDPGTLDTAFEAVAADQMVVVSGLRVWSLCEHHLLPYWCDVTVGYIPAGRVLGLSKFARIAHARAHALSIQERLVEQVAADVARLTGAEDVAVVARGEHLCMTMRGVRTPGLMTSSVLKGAFRSDASVRSEFMSLALAGGR